MSVEDAHIIQLILPAHFAIMGVAYHMRIFRKFAEVVFTGLTILIFFIRVSFWAKPVWYLRSFSFRHRYQSLRPYFDMFPHSRWASLIGYFYCSSLPTTKILFTWVRFLNRGGSFLNSFVLGLSTSSLYLLVASSAGCPTPNHRQYLMSHTVVPIALFFE